MGVAGGALRRGHGPRSRLAGRKVQDREPPARLQRSQEAGVHGLRVAEVMVDVADEHRVAAAGGKSGVFELPGRDNHIGEAL